MTRPSALLGTIGCAAAALAACMPPYQMAADPHPRSCDPAAVNPVADWYFPAQADDHQPLDAFCREVGPVVADSIPAAAFGPLTPTDSLAIAVWNTDAGAGHMTAFLEQELGLRCAGPDSRLVGPGGHFVLLVQEALRRTSALEPTEPRWSVPPPVKENRHPDRRLGVTEVARECGLSLVYAPAARNGWEQVDGRGEDKGNAILSTLPLSDFVVMELPYEAARRVVVAATVRSARGDSLRLASVHLIATPPPWRVLETGNSSRLRQALATVDGLRLVEADRAADPHDTVPTISTVIAGDLNTWSVRETTLRHLFDHFPDSPGPLAEPTRGPFPTDHLLFRSNPRRLTRDRILDHSYRRIEDPYYSDHMPVIAWFRFGED